MIDIEKIKIPNLIFTPNARKELDLIIENDFTLAGKYFRLLISGKGCEGFTYSVGFTDLNEDDLLVKDLNDPNEHCVVIDPFTAFYLAHVTVDFIFDPLTNEEGFVVINHDEKNYRGKFFKEEQAELPPLLGATNA